MNMQDKRKMQMLLEQMQQDASIVDLEGNFYVSSVDQTGEIGVAGKYNVGEHKWVEPMQVFGVEEPAGSGQKYSKKTQQMLELFKRGDVHYVHLKAMAAIIARELEERESGEYTASEYYYNFNKRIFNSKTDDWSGTKHFRSIMKLYKGKSVD
jgi:hypothetical protein